MSTATKPKPKAKTFAEGLDNTTKASVANLIRYGAKIIQADGWSHKDTRGPKGEFCMIASVVEAALRSGFNPHVSLVEKAVDVLDEAAKSLPKEELYGSDFFNYAVRYNMAEKRTITEVVHFMGHTANQLTKWKL